MLLREIVRLLFEHQFQHICPEVRSEKYSQLYVICSACSQANSYAFYVTGISTQSRGVHAVVVMSYPSPNTVRIQDGEFGKFQTTK